MLGDGRVQLRTTAQSTDRKKDSSLGMGFLNLIAHAQ